MSSASNVFSQMLMQHGQRVREQQLADIAARKQQQDYALEYAKAQMSNPMLDPEAQDEYRQKYVEMLEMPPQKFEVSKAKLGAPFENYHKRMEQQVIQQFPHMLPPGKAGSPAIAAPQMPQQAPQAPPMPEQGSGSAPPVEQQQALQPPPMPAPPEAAQQPLQVAGMGLDQGIPPFSDWKRIIPQLAAQYGAQYGAQENAQADAKMRIQEAIEQRLRGLPEFKQLNAVQKIQAITGGQVSPEGKGEQLKFAPVMIEVGGKPTPAYDTGIGIYVDLQHNPIDPQLITSTKTRSEGTESQAPFAVTKAALEKELGRDLTSTEAVELNRRLAGGEPIYPVVTGRGIVYMSRAQAVGQQAPRTIYDLEGMPTTGGQQGVSLQPPPPLSPSIQQALTDAQNAIDMFTDVDKMLSNPKFSTLGPALGRVKLGEVGKLGGLGATPEQITLATNLQRLLNQQSFAQGGKQLTPTELEQFKKTTPALDDTLQQAIIKTKESLRILKRNYQNRLKAIPARQRAQVGGLETSEPPNPPDTGEKIRVRRKADGKTGTIVPADFDPAKYEKL